MRKTKLLITFFIFYYLQTAFKYDIFNEINKLNLNFPIRKKVLYIQNVEKSAYKTHQQELDILFNDNPVFLKENKNYNFPDLNLLLSPIYEIINLKSEYYLMGINASNNEVEVQCDMVKKQIKIKEEIDKLLEEKLKE